MTQSPMTGETTIGIDLGDRKSHICVLSSEGEVLERAEAKWYRHRHNAATKPEREAELLPIPRLVAALCRCRYRYAGVGTAVPASSSQSLNGDPVRRRLRH